MLFFFIVVQSSIITYIKHMFSHFLVYPFIYMSSSLQKYLNKSLDNFFALFMYLHIVVHVTSVASACVYRHSMTFDNIWCLFWSLLTLVFRHCCSVNLVNRTKLSDSEALFCISPELPLCTHTMLYLVCNSVPETEILSSFLHSKRFWYPLKNSQHFK